MYSFGLIPNNNFFKNDALIRRYEPQNEPDYEYGHRCYLCEGEGEITGTRTDVREFLDDKDYDGTDICYRLKIWRRWEEKKLVPCPECG